MQRFFLSWSGESGSFRVSYSPHEGSRVRFSTESGVYEQALTDTSVSTTAPSTGTRTRKRITPLDVRRAQSSAVRHRSPATIRQPFPLASGTQLALAEAWAGWSWSPGGPRPAFPDPVWYEVPMRIRRGVASDADAVANVFLAARAEMTYLPELHTEEETRQWIRTVVLQELEVWVADDDGRVVGFTALKDELLEHLYVHPHDQNSGVGTGLLGLSKQRRPRGLRLWVFQRNVRARRFYESHGFALTRLTDGSDNEEREPDALYEWVP